MAQRHYAVSPGYPRTQLTGASTLPGITANYRRPRTGPSLAGGRMPEKSGQRLPHAFIIPKDAKFMGPPASSELLKVLVRQGLQRPGEFPPRPLLRIDPIPGSTEAMSTSTPAVPDSNPRTNRPPEPPGREAERTTALLGPTRARSRGICPDRWRGSCPRPFETLYGP